MLIVILGDEDRSKPAEVDLVRLNGELDCDTDKTLSGTSPTPVISGPP